MSQKFLARGQMVGYDADAKTLIATMSDQIADKMRADGWEIHTNDEVGNFITISNVEVSDGNT